MEKVKRNPIIHKNGEGAVSPLGFSVQEVYDALCREQSEARHYDGLFELPESCFVSLLSRARLSEVFGALRGGGKHHYTPVEQAAIVAASQALTEAQLTGDRSDLIFILSTTKGNVDLLDSNPYEPERVYLWRTAELVATYFGNTNTPIVVSNACISGCAAQITAINLLRSGQYRHAVVVGVDMLSKFVISGFQSFKALSAERCKPFDAHRCGLNLGEAAAAMVLTASDDASALPAGTLILRHGAIQNDANHISGPSRTAEGLYRAIQKVLPEPGDREQIAFINAHGTATVYNDDMESVAIQRAALSHVPVNSLKGYFGHTLGAAGVLETLISAHELSDRRVLKTLGTQEAGTAATANICLQTQPVQGDTFLKLISGFGGCNAAMLFSIIR